MAGFRLRNRLFAFFAVTAAVIGVPGNGGAQNGKSEAAPSKTVWEGVYTEIQADRGMRAYEANCVSCHSSGPPTSETFMRNWSGTDLGGVFDQIKSSMPADAPSSLSDRIYLDILAYMLRADEFPSGKTELGETSLKSVRVDPKDGSKQVPNFALVSVVGCLVQEANKAWRLTNASEPVRTKDPDASKDDELKYAQAASLGGQKFLLMDVYPAPDSLKGSRVEAKGFLIRDSQENRLNVTSIQSVAARCETPRN